MTHAIPLPASAVANLTRKKASPPGPGPRRRFLVIVSSESLGSPGTGAIRITLIPKLLIQFFVFFEGRPIVVFLRLPFLHFGCVSLGFLLPLAAIGDGLRFFIIDGLL